MTDRELLEAAAKAAGYQVRKTHTIGTGASAYPMAETINPDGVTEYWSPVGSDADAFRLAVMLSMTVSPCRARIAHPYEPELCKPLADVYVDAIDGDVMAATRRAIVRAAAETRKHAE